MKILYIVPSLIQAGPVNVALDLVTVMQQHGHTCDVAYLNERNDRAHNHFPCTVIKAKQIRWEEYDVVHTHGFRPDLLARMKMPRHLRSRLVSTMHNFVFVENRMRFGPIKGWLLSKVQLWAARKHPNIITLTDAAREYYAKYFRCNQLHVCCNTRMLAEVLPEADDLEVISQFKQKNCLKYVIGTNCSFTYRKGLEQVIKALSHLPEEGLILIGDGPQMQELQEEAKAQRVDDRVLWLGRRSQAYRYIPLFDLFVIPSRSEGFPLSLLEAAAMGKASVSSDIDVFKTTFPEDDVLPKFHLDDIVDFAEKIKLALGKNDVLGKRIKEKFESDYSPGVFYQQHMAVYNQR